MKLPHRWNEFRPPEAVRQVLELIGQPSLLQNVKDGAAKLGLRDRWPASSIGEAVQQARRWVESVTSAATQSPPTGVIVNASGMFFNERWRLLPTEGSGEASILGEQGGAFAAHDMRLSLPRLAEAMRAERAIVIHSLPFVLSVLGKVPSIGKSLLIPRSDCIRYYGQDVRRLLESNAKVTEIGAINACGEDDFAREFSRVHGSVVTVGPGALDDPHQLGPHHDIAIQLAKQHRLLSIEILLHASPLHLQSYGLDFPLLRDRMESGVDLLIVPGEGLLGAPSSAIVLGKAAVVDELESVAVSFGGGPHPSVLPKIQTAVEAACDFETWRQTSIGGLMTTSDANLLERARRLAIQCEASEEVSKVEVVTDRVPLGSGIWERWQVATPMVRVFPRAPSSDSMVRKIGAGPIPMEVLAAKDHFNIVLRTVFPYQDRWIGDFFMSRAEETPKDELATSEG